MKKKSAPTRRRTSPALALRLARAQLRAIRQYAAPDVDVNQDLKAHVEGIPIPGTGPAKFVQCWTASRGPYNSITQALDSSGQVWERVSLMEDVEVEGRKVKQVKDSWWVPLKMTRRSE